GPRPGRAPPQNPRKCRKVLRCARASWLSPQGGAPGRTAAAKGKQPGRRGIPPSYSGRSDLRQGDALLSLVLAAAVAVRNLAHLVGLDEDDLGDALVGIDLGGQRRRVGELERHVALPLGLERRDVDDDAAARVGRLAEADREDVPRDAEELHGARERERVRRDDADVAAVVDEVLL